MRDLTAAEVKAHIAEAFGCQSWEDSLAQCSGITWWLGVDCTAYSNAKRTPVEADMANSDAALQHVLDVAAEVSRQARLAKVPSCAVIENPEPSRLWGRKVARKLMAPSTQFAVLGAPLQMKLVSYCCYGFAVQKNTMLLVSLCVARNFQPMQCNPSDCAETVWDSSTRKWVHTEHISSMQSAGERSLVPPALARKVLCAASMGMRQNQAQSGSALTSAMRAALRSGQGADARVAQAHTLLAQLEPCPVMNGRFVPKQAMAVRHALPDDDKPGFKVLIQWEGWELRYSTCEPIAKFASFEGLWGVICALRDDLLEYGADAIAQGTGS